MPDKKRFLLRLPPDVYVDVQRLAAAELRSVNAEIEHLLRLALKQRLGGARSTDVSKESEDEPS